MKKLKTIKIKASCGGQGCKITILPVYIKKYKLAA